MELLVGMYGEVIATLMLALAAMPFFKKLSFWKAALYPVSSFENKQENAVARHMVTETEASK